MGAARPSRELVWGVGNGSVWTGIYLDMDTLTCRSVYFHFKVNLLIRYTYESSMTVLSDWRA